MSYGFILIKLNNITYSSISDKIKNLNISYDFITNYNNKYFFKNIHKLIEHYHKLNILFIKRKHSYSFLTLIKGSFCDKDSVNKIIKGLTYNEIKLLKSRKDYSKICKDDCNYKYKQCNADKFNNFINQKLDLLSYDNAVKLDIEFPKGKLDKDESVFNCATREVNEETTLSINNDYIYLSKNIIFNETFIGTDKCTYNWNYFLGILNPSIDTSIINIDNNYEVSEINLIDYTDICSNLPNVSHFYNKRKFIFDIYIFIINFFYINT